MIIKPEPIDWNDLANPISLADRAITRLDERLRQSPLRKGILARFDLADTLAAIANEGFLIHFEDLALHDLQMDVRQPTQELVRASVILGVRRKAAKRDPEKLMTLQGLQGLVGAWDAKPRSPDTAAITSSSYVSDLLALADSLLKGEDFDDEAALPESKADEAFDTWRATVQKSGSLPPVLGAAQVMIEWKRTSPIPRHEWLGPFLATAYLRSKGVTTMMLPVHLGLRQARRENIKHPPLRARVEGLIWAAQEGLEMVRRMETTIELLQAHTKDRRGESFEKLIQMFIDKPVVTIGMIGKEFGITKQAAAYLLKNLGPIRELSGRDKYRAWGI